VTDDCAMCSGHVTVVFHVEMFAVNCYTTVVCRHYS